MPDAVVIFVRRNNTSEKRAFASAAAGPIAIGGADAYLELADSGRLAVTEEQSHRRGASPPRFLLPMLAAENWTNSERPFSPT